MYLHCFNRFVYIIVKDVPSRLNFVDRADLQSHQSASIVNVYVCTSLQIM